jgi:dephospho-CoA kinase
VWIIGIIGDIAAGKSTVARHLQSVGATWIDADAIARSTLQSDVIRPALVAALGDQIIDADGTVDRQAIAAKVFGDDETSKKKLQALESIVHPVVRQTIRNRLIEIAGARDSTDSQDLPGSQAAPESPDSQHNRLPGSRIVVLDVPLLIESGWVRVCDEVWMVIADEEVRRVRARARGWSDQELARRTSAQVSSQIKRRHSHRLLANNGDLAELHEKIEKWLLETPFDSKKMSNLRHCGGQKWPPIV